MEYVPLSGWLAPAPCALPPPRPQVKPSTYKADEYNRAWAAAPLNNGGGGAGPGGPGLSMPEMAQLAQALALMMNMRGSSGGAPS